MRDDVTLATITNERSGVLKVTNVTIDKHTRTITIEDKLKNWNWLEKRRRHLERIIPEQEDRLKTLKDKLSSSGILSSITQQYNDMPHASGVSDKVGDMVASTLDTVSLLEQRILDWRRELCEVYIQLADIEYEVYQLKETYQQVLTKYYRDGLSQKQVADSLYLSKSWVEKVLYKSIRSFKGLL